MTVLPLSGYGGGNGGGGGYGGGGYSKSSVI